MTENKNLCVVTGNLIIPEECFIDGGAEKMLALLRAKLKEFVPDPTTPKGLEEIRSFAAKFPKSKTAFEKAGKEFKEQYKVKITPIDKERKIFREACDEMRDEARLPLTLHEAEQDRIIEEERKRVEQEIEDERLKAEQVLIDRENEIARKEAEFAKIEADKLAKEKAEQAEKDRIEYEAKVKADAEAKAKKDAEEALLKEQQEKERLILEAADREKQIKIDAENAEQKRLSDIATENLRVAEESLKAAEKAAHEKNEAIAKIKREQEEKEKAEKKRIADEKIILDRKAANLNHQKAVNNKVLKKIIAALDIPGTRIQTDEAKAKSIMESILKNPIAEITINY